MSILSWFILENLNFYSEVIYVRRNTKKKKKQGRIQVGMKLGVYNQLNLIHNELVYRITSDRNQKDMGMGLYHSTALVQKFAPSRMCLSTSYIHVYCRNLG